MNTPIRRVSVAVIALIVVLLANATYVQVIKADKLRSDPRNDRVLLDEYSRQRGSIIAGGEVIAMSQATDSRYKYLRRYPVNPRAFAPITGYYSIQYGSAGLEQYENSILSGNDDRLFGQRFTDMFSGRDPRGGNVVTTIDPRLQQIAYDQLNSGATCDGPCVGAVVAMDPSTGKILAMASTPSYDPNLLSSHDQNVREAAWGADTGADKRLQNRATDEIYPPGSTFKIITSSAALRDGLNASTQLTAASTFQLPDSTAKLPNYGDETCPGGSGTVSLADAVKYSCNTAFADLVLNKMPNATDTLKETARLYGLDSPAPNIPMPVARSTVGTIPDRASLALSAIGQKDVAMSTLQNAMVAATVANAGVRMQPYLVDKLQSADLRTLYTTPPTTINSPITSEQAASLTSMMVGVENASNPSGGPVQIASKTGTAEHGDENSATPYSWYIAFGPSTDAKIAVAVVVENGKFGVQSVGNTVAGPIGRAVINAYVGGGR
ncbi:penicillin-binding protein A [Gordonia polyisoprenivorans VH2]|uniref:Penicillin-binding protein A n=1 Tax=Gordonia polyisoprenivorans (strain DSM 44266 / VH2) TaxID=1112204 RepID=H6N362_GORPV|nr:MULTISPECIES: penicillin-binding protein 2 [Gordonia]AFA71101.1 penicillin-binding protein A [Gordonia polyisoprenivorans VH2]MBE7192178.1 penicillin-binding protein 2 [Gordonia polyisoprenivorans]MDF3285102.1 penicillin-binding protein 2 [Gordonia sp. N1V]OPX17359.1 penicillin-binding protein [Gordonia sp. i37]OZC33050.1 penicillin-binding protein 2 [Gordonia polyisoprenivorans]